MTDRTIELCNRAKERNKTFEQWLQLEEDIVEYLKTDCPPEERHMFVPLGWLEMVATICSGIRKIQQESNQD